MYAAVVYIRLRVTFFCWPWNLLRPQLKPKRWVDLRLKGNTQKPYIQPVRWGEGMLKTALHLTYSRGRYILQAASLKTVRSVITVLFHTHTHTHKNEETDHVLVHDGVRHTRILYIYQNICRVYSSFWQIISNKSLNAGVKQKHALIV